MSEFDTTDAGAATEPCPDEPSRLNLIPRKVANIFDRDMKLKPLLPDRYPNAESRLKDIERNFYVDLALVRTVTAVVTDDLWAAGTEPRPAATPGTTVYFKLGENTAGATLSAEQAVTDANGCATITVTHPNTLYKTTADIEAHNKIEIRASLSADGSGVSQCITLTVHRNEDFQTALADGETPDEYVTTLKPILDLKTWIVRQASDHVTSAGGKAVQQLLNQVACRKLGGGHVFLKPDGQFGSGSKDELARFIRDFGAAGSGEAGFRAAQFNVRVEDRVKEYITAEYVTYAEGMVVDAHVLVGLEEWKPGADKTVMSADGLLDIYRAVVWLFMEKVVEKSGVYIELSIRWIRHPDDDGPNTAPNDLNWPDVVQQGEAYTYGGSDSSDEFTAALNGNNPGPTTIARWNQYTSGAKVGFHKGEYDVDSSPLSQYTGIDCSAFVQRITIESTFPAEHCSDLVGVRISQEVPANMANRLGTSTWVNHYRQITKAFKKDVVFRGDALNVSGSHIVMLLMNNRASITGTMDDSQNHIAQACGTLMFGGRRAPMVSINAGYVRDTECTRRVLRSPLAYWSTFYNDWQGTGVADRCHYGRIYFWP